MHIVLIHIEGLSNPVALRFDDRERAEATSALGPVTDDYGQSVTVAPEHVRAVCVMDVERDLEAQMEMQRIQARANSRFAADPAMSLHAARGGLIRPS